MGHCDDRQDCCKGDFLGIEIIVELHLPPDQFTWSRITVVGHKARLGTPMVGADQGNLNGSLSRKTQEC